MYSNGDRRRMQIMFRLFGAGLSQVLVKVVHFVLNLARSVLKKSTVKKVLFSICTLVILPLYNLRPNLLRVILAHSPPG